MAKTKKPKKQTAEKKRMSKGQRLRGISSSQTHQPQEQDSKRRIGQYGGAGEPPIMK